MSTHMRSALRGLFLALTLASVTVMATAVSAHAKVATGGCLEGGADCLEAANPIQPDPTVVDPGPRPWDSVSVAGDGRTLTVYFWMGSADCNGLHSVDVIPAEIGIDIRLNTGTPAGAEDLVCIQIAELYSTIVQLEEPLIGGGIFAS